jgi:murein DD-endopeptidase MepM/ murein hydrolase activator NlpD/phosphosulfolactate phosphohydrolase-like enzyme
MEMLGTNRLHQSDFEGVALAMARLELREQARRSVGDRPTRRFRISLTGRRKLVLASIIAVMAVVVYVGVSNRESVYVVKAGDKVLGCIEDKTICEQILNRIAEEEAIRTCCEVTVETDVTLEKAGPKDATKILTPDELAEALKENTVLVAKGYVVSVNGNEVVALASEEDARGALSDLRAEYIRTVIGAQASVEEVLIKEQIDFQEKVVPTSMFRRRSEAAQVLSRGTDRTLNYVVQRGDSLWDIARRNNLSVDDLIESNPGVKPDLIQIGQNINLIVPQPYVTLTSKEIVVSTVSIPYSVEVSQDSEMWPWQEKVTQAGKNGQKEVIEEISRENGKIVSRAKVSEKILSYPVTKKVIRGSKQVPAMGSGSMVWPVQGTITSKFGYRWGSFHKGVDIGAPTGTEVLAADSGMVTSAGWNGGYGNCVKIDHGGGKVTLYAHLSKMAVATGATVEKGQVIGYVGSTGVSTGPHLHFEVHVDGVAKDPLSYYE